jgi:predicted enzyme related to lactoylglutathione lyase
MKPENPELWRSCGYRYAHLNSGELHSLRTIYEKLKAKGVKILKVPTAPPYGGLFFYFEDVEGNIIEVAYSMFIPLD